MTNPAARAPDLRGRAARSTVWNLAGQAIQLAMGMGVFVLLARWISPDDYGRVTMAGTVTGLLGVLGDAGVTNAILRLPAMTDRLAATGFWVAVGGAVILTGAGVVAAPIMGILFQDRDVGWMALGLAFSFLLAAPSRVPTASLSRSLRFKTLASATLGSNVAGAAVALLAARAGAGGYALVLQTLVTFTVQSMWLCVASPYRVSSDLFSKEDARQIASFSWRMSGFSVSAAAARSGDPVLGGRLLGPEAPGLLGMAVRLVASPVQKITSSLSGVFLPTLLQVPAQARGRAFARVVRISLLAISPVCVGVAVTAPEVVAWLPPRWAGLTGTLQAVSVGMLMEPIGWLAISVLTADGRAGAMLKAGLAFVPLFWAGSLIGVVHGNVERLAWAYAVTNSLGGLLLLALVWKRLELGSWFWWGAARPVGLMVVAGLTARLAVRGAAISGTRDGLWLGVVVGAVVYGMGLLAFQRGDLRWAIDAVRSRNA